MTTRVVHYYLTPGPDDRPIPGAQAVCGHLLEGEFHPATPEDTRCLTCRRIIEEPEARHVG